MRFLIGIMAITFFVIVGGFTYWNATYFRAEPGFVYHVRTYGGENLVIEGTGLKRKNFGKVNAWKKAMSIAAGNVTTEQLSAEQDSARGASANLPALDLLFLDNVNAEISATARFRIPTGEEDFLKLVEEYRTPANFINQELIPAFQNTLDATTGLMRAEDYYSGSKSEFQIAFREQMENGIYKVIRKEVKEQVVGRNSGTNESLDTESGPDTKTNIIVEVIEDENGFPVTRPQNFSNFGVQLVSARIIKVEPNASFRERMKLSQDSSAARSLARNDRLKEEEKRLFAIAEGERIVAEEKAKAEALQIKLQTEAETAADLTIIKARENLAKEKLSLEQAQVQLEKKRLDAESLKLAADAEAYAKAAVIEADGALDKKLNALVEIHKAYAAALSQMPVPQTVIGGSTETGNVDTVNQFMNTQMGILAAQLNAKELTQISQ